jgi:hypothetical protein
MPTISQPASGNAASSPADVNARARARFDRGIELLTELSPLVTWSDPGVAPASWLIGHVNRLRLRRNMLAFLDCVNQKRRMPPSRATPAPAATPPIATGADASMKAKG